jgi:hypothetical protein
MHAAVLLSKFLVRFQYRPINGTIAARCDRWTFFKKRKKKNINMLKGLLLLTLATGASALCANSCSGHGTLFKIA